MKGTDTTHRAIFLGLGLGLGLCEQDFTALHTGNIRSVSKVAFKRYLRRVLASNSFNRAALGSAVTTIAHAQTFDAEFRLTRSKIALHSHD